VSSDGSSILTLRDKNFELIDSIIVIDEHEKTTNNLNELECANGKIYANRWHSNFIYEINPINGRVTRKYDCSKIVEQEKKSTHWIKLKIL
jgi:glutamine cyclotransferase